MEPRAVLLAGPSGSGKSTLAAKLGWPVLRLDDFYRDGDDPLLPRDEHGRADWDAEGSWNTGAALQAVITLAREGTIEAPVYSIGEDRKVGTQTVSLNGANGFIAEGLFADLLVDGARQAGVLKDAIVLAPSAPVTFARRFLRDVAEARKPIPVLLRRGWRLMREQPGVVRRCERQGMRRLTPNQARDELAESGRPADSAAV
ncbi:ATP-binding protein [Lentzea sp. NBRC 105346]|uniref:uridine kinase family protein n=1 Tax=Lentzea sp. NBRC 105346 TaxID=3032205 RepID=UPI0024A5262E|nr:uridine kinase [Lentzea sp. NBRC 105346]GLZ28797.1 ATP-binding protein [Lentzea sp. NBRC 105346]